MKKIVFISHGLSNGGLQRVASIISNRLSEKNYEVSYISVYSNDNVYKLNDKINNIYIETNSKNKIIKFIQRSIGIYKQVKIHKPDTIISFVYLETILLLFYKKAKKIYSLRNAPIFFGKFKMLIIKILFNYSDLVVFQTDEAKKFFNKKIQEKSCIIENPISSNLPYWKDYHHNKFIICAARLEEQKNLKLLIDGVNVVHKKHPDYKLYIYGDGSLYDELIEYINNKNMQKYAFIKNFSSNIYELIAQSSIFVLPSNYEGISNSMIEALGIGIPTICTDCPVGGARMYIKNNNNGILIPVGNVESLIRGLNKIIENKEFAVYLSNNAIRIREQLSEDTIVNEWEKII